MLSFWQSRQYCNLLAKLTKSLPKKCSLDFVSFKKPKVFPFMSGLLNTGFDPWQKMQSLKHNVRAWQGKT